MSKRGSEVKVGLFILVAVLLFVFGVLFLQEYTFRGGGYHLKVLFTNVTGLRDGDPVEVAGLKVGSVKSMTLREGKVEVHLWIDGKVKLPRDSRFTIQSLGALGDKVISIRPGTSSERLKEGDRVSGGAEWDIADLLRMVEPLNEDIRSVLKRLALLLDEGVQQHLKGSLSNIETITDQVQANIQANLQDLDGILGNLNEASGDLRKLLASQDEEDLKAITQDIKSTAKSLKEASSALSRSLITLEGLLKKAESGQGTLGKLITDKGLYEHLDKLVRDLDELVEDVKKNPKKYIHVEIL